MAHAKLQVHCNEDKPRFNDTIHIERISADRFKVWATIEDGSKVMFEGLGDSPAGIWVGVDCTLTITGVNVGVRRM